MIADVLSAIDEIYIQEAESEFNSCLEIINEYDKIFKTRENIFINTNNIEQFFQENAWSDDVKKQNRGKSTLNKILFTIPRMIISLFRLITGKLKKNKLPDKTQAQHLEQQIAHINPKKIKVSKSGSAANVIAIVGGSLTLGAAGALTYLGFRKATSSATTNATPEDIDHNRPVAVIESTDTGDEKSDEKSNEEVDKLNEEIAKLTEQLNQANIKDEEIAKLKKEKQDLNDRLELVRNSLARSQGERDQAKRESTAAKQELVNLKIEVGRKISPEVVSERLSGLYGEMINIFKECLNMAKRQSSPEERQAIIDKFNELQNRLNVTQSDSDKEKVRLSITEICESTNNNISELNKKIEEINRLKTEAENLNNTITANNKKIDGLEKKLEKANKALEAAKNKNRETRKENFGKFKQNFKTALSSMPGSIKELETRKKEISESIDSLNVQKQQLENQVNELRKQSGELSSEISQKTEEKQSLNGSITAKRTNVGDLEDQIQQNQTNLDNIKSEIDNQKKEQDAQKKEFDKLNGELTKLESNIKAKQAELAKAEEQAKTNNTRLSTENEQLKKDLAKYIAAYESARKTIESYKIAEEERRKTFNTELNKTQYQITTAQDARSDEHESSIDEDIARTAVQVIESLGKAMTEDVQEINDIQIITNELQNQTTGSEYIHDSQEKPDPTKLSNDELVKYIQNTDNDSSQEDQSTETDESTSNEETQTTDDKTVQSETSDKPETNEDEDKSEEVQPLNEDDNKLDISGIINDNTYSAKDLFTNVEKWRNEKDKKYRTYSYFDKEFSSTDNPDANYIGVPLDEHHFLIYPNKTESFDVKGTMSYVFKCAGIKDVKDNDIIRPCLADSNGKIVQNGEFIKSEENTSSNNDTQENQRQDEQQNQQQSVSKPNNVEQPVVSSNNVRNENRVTANDKQQKAVDNNEKRSFGQSLIDGARNLFSGKKQQDQQRQSSNLADAVKQYTDAANNVSNQIDAAQNRASDISSAVQNVSRSANEDDERKNYQQKFKADQKEVQKYYKPIPMAEVFAEVQKLRRMISSNETGPDYCVYDPSVKNFEYSSDPLAKFIMVPIPNNTNYSFIYPNQISPFAKKQLADTVYNCNLSFIEEYHYLKPCIVDASGNILIQGEISTDGQDYRVYSQSDNVDASTSNYDNTSDTSASDNKTKYSNETTVSAGNSKLEPILIDEMFGLIMKVGSHMSDYNAYYGSFNPGISDDSPGYFGLSIPKRSKPIDAKYLVFPYKGYLCAFPEQRTPFGNVHGNIDKKAYELYGITNRDIDGYDKIKPCIVNNSGDIIEKGWISAGENNAPVAQTLKDLESY